MTECVEIIFLFSWRGLSLVYRVLYWKLYIFVYPPPQRLKHITLLLFPSVVEKVEVEVPSSWNAGVIRFKWKQESFHNAFESWALDDVRVGVPLTPHHDSNFVRNPG